MTIPWVSTSVYPGLSALSSASRLVSEGFRKVEFSGGPFEPDWESKLRRISQDAEVAFHNYFPSPLEPFVLNLSTDDAGQWAKSFEHVARLIDLSAQYSAGVTSIHAGFIAALTPDCLGHGTKGIRLMNPDDSRKRFEEGVFKLGQRALEAGVRLLVENNVLVPSSLKDFDGFIPFLLCTPDEMVSFLDLRFPGVGLLLDYGHLKVTSQTLGFDLNDAIAVLAPLSEGLHLSENNGYVDSNDSFENSQGAERSVSLSNASYISIEVCVSGPSELERLREAVKAWAVKR